jgi:hypothetical protein
MNCHTRALPPTKKAIQQTGNYSLIQNPRNGARRVESEAKAHTTHATAAVQTIRARSKSFIASVRTTKARKRWRAI